MSSASWRVAFRHRRSRLEASVGEAAAWAKQGDWARVVTELLQNPNGAFRQAAQAKPDNEFFARGLMLLAEAN